MVSNVNTQKPKLVLYDTTLRDGTQMEGISLSVEDKLKIAKKLDELGYITSKAGGPDPTPRTPSSSPGSGTWT